MGNITALQITVREKKYQSRHSCPQRILVRHMLNVSYLGIKFCYKTTISSEKAMKVLERNAFKRHL